MIEDNERLAALMDSGLKQCGIRCDLAHELESAITAFRVASCDAILLDLGLPDGVGLAWLQTPGKEAHRPPTLIITAGGALGDRVKGLDSGRARSQGRFVS